MRISTCATLTRALVALGVLLAATSVHAQAANPGRNLNVMAVNLDNKQIYSVTFTGTGGSTTVGNTDENNYVRPDALAFVTNATTFQLDLLVADNQRGTISRYPGALAPQTPPNPTTATLVWNMQSGPGPAAPDALAVDGYGNLFVANSTSGHSQSSQLWMLPVGTSGPGSFGAPVLLDSSFQSKETLLELALVPTDVANGPAGVSGGDLIALTTSRVLVYSQSSHYTARTTLLSFPNGSPVPGGMDFWPIGNGTANYSLLVSSSSSAVINRYYFGSQLTVAPTFYTGVGTFYRIKTLFQQGNPLVFLSAMGSIVELGADANGNGTLLATVTQNVTTPQGLAVSNSFTNAASVCLQPSGCNLTGLLTHTVRGVHSLVGDIVENVCTLAADPRVAIVAGVWSCKVPYTPPSGFSCPPGMPNCLPVNAICPGFDDTGKMVIPDTLCGRSGSSGAGFSLIKTLVNDGQLWVPSGNTNAGGYVQHELVNADGSNPLCGAGAAADGAVIWAPLLAEGTEVGAPGMQDISSGCGSGKAGTSGFSVFGEGFFVNEGATELNPPLGGLPLPLENLAQTKFLNLTATIDNLTQSDPNHPRWKGSNANVAANVSLLLWGGNQPGVPPGNNPDAFGCLDQSWLDFYNAATFDSYGSPQFIADLQNGANLLTDADATGNTTCQGIIDYAQANTPNAFVQTSQSPNSPSVLNPYGQLVSLTASLYYTANTRLLGHPYSGAWPLPVSVNVLPTSVTLASSTSPGSASLYWNTHGDSGCSLTSSDSYYSGVALDGLTPPFALTIPASDAPQGGAPTTIVQYTVSCSNGPPASSVSAYVNVYPPPTLTVSVPAVAQNGTATLTWNTNHAQGCTASTTDPTPADAFQGPISGANSMPLTPTSAGSFTYTMTCATPAVVAQAGLTVVAPSTVGPATQTIVQGSTATLTWNSNGGSVCTWNSTDPALNGAAATSSPTTWTPAVPGSYPYTYTYTLNCATPASTVSQPVNVIVQPLAPSISVSPSSITQGNSANLSWTINTGDVCTGSSTGTDTNAADAFSGMKGVSGSLTVTPNATGTDTYYLNCTVPPTTQSATLTVNPSLAKIAISVKPIYDLDIGDPGILSWTLSGGATGCVVSGTWPKFSVPQFSAFPVSASGSKQVTWKTAGVYSYTLSCTNPSTPVQTSVTITNDK
jgi:hypothetical protein